MPEVELSDGTRIHWDERGSGPLVVAAFACLSSPMVFAPLIDALVAEHRVVTYDPRGFGASSPAGPYDRETDAADLRALVEELAEPAVIVATGDGCNRAVRVAAAVPELVQGVVTPGGNPVGRSVARTSSEALVASQSVLDLLVETMRADYRAGLRMAIGPANPQLEDDAVRERVDEQAAYAPREPTLERLRWWIADEAADEARAIGGRLWMLEHPNNPWFPLELARETRRILPEANVVEVEDGALSRPEFTVDVVRRLTARRPAPEAASS
jgi:pimeloyl-ACP methyl ester carboxylesterase